MGKNIAGIGGLVLVAAFFLGQEYWLVLYITDPAYTGKSIAALIKLIGGGLLMYYALTNRTKNTA